MNPGLFYRTHNNAGRLAELMLDDNKEVRLSAYAGIGRAYAASTADKTLVAIRNFCYAINEVAVADKALETTVRHMVQLTENTVEPYSDVECAADILGVKSTLGEDCYKAIGEHSEVFNSATRAAYAMVRDYCDREKRSNEV